MVGFIKHYHLGNLISSIILTGVYFLKRPFFHGVPPRLRQASHDPKAKSARRHFLQRSDICRSAPNGGERREVEFFTSCEVDLKHKDYIEDR